MKGWENFPMFIPTMQVKKTDKEIVACGPIIAFGVVPMTGKKSKSEI